MGLSGWRRYGVALLLGISAVAALPPVDLSPLLVVAFPGLLWLDEGSSGPSSSFGLGYAFGFGFFVAGLYWISGALFVDIAAFWWLVPIAAVGLPALFRAGFRICDRLDRRRMDPGPCIYRAPLEPDRVDMVRRFSGRDRGLTVRSLDRHLWIELCDGACRLITRAPWGIVSRPNFGVPALDAGDRCGAFGACTRRVGSGSAGNVANCD
jgi:hypothetical protein